MNAVTKEQKIIAAAREVFTRYGYKRTTMGDVATAADISRPALYLVYSSKEEVFAAVLESIFAEQFALICDGLCNCTTVHEKLAFAFEIWCVEPYKMVLDFPDAKDLLESSYSVADTVTHAGWAKFESLLTEVLSEAHQTAEDPKVTAAQTAHILAAAVPGFKNSATSVAELQAMIDNLLTLVLDKDE